MTSCRDAKSAFNHIKSFIERKADSVVIAVEDINLLEEIRRVGFSRFIDANDDFDRLHLKIDSETFPSIKVLINKKDAQCEYFFESNEIPKMTLPLQKGFLAKVIKKSHQFANNLDLVAQQIFFKLDENFDTLKPERFDKKAFWRRIHIDPKIDRQIKVAYNFVSDGVVLTHESKDSIFKNYESLERELKSILKSSVSKSESLECGICYSDFLDGSLADFTCAENSSSGRSGCNQVYHENCLREWFRANPESRTIFDRICGKCLFCEKVKRNY